MQSLPRASRVSVIAAVLAVTLGGVLASAAPAGANGVEWPAPGVVSTGLGPAGSGHPDPSGRVVALTFDDGPHPTHTPAILDTLARNHITATFFVLEQNAVRHPELIRRMVREGHAVAAHSVSHPRLDRLSASQQRYQIVRSADAIDAIAGPGTASCIRPPYGAYNSTTVAIARERGLGVALWSRDTNDWRGYSTGAIVANATTPRYDGGRGVVLLHDSVAATRQALQPVIDSLRSNGYRFTTICGSKGSTGTTGPAAVGMDAPDLDGDGVDDLFWYAPGTAPDFLWRGGRTGEFQASPATVNGRFTPLVGDFDGNDADDVFWYAPGSAPDFFWRWDGAGFGSRSVTVNGTYTPLIGDFDGNGADDIFWYAPGSAPDFVWSWDGKGFATTAFPVNGTYRPLVGDLDGNGADDIFWYAPGTAPDFVWRASGAGFSPVEVAVNGRYQPFLRTVDGRDEVLWAAPGTAPDFAWRWQGDGFASREMPMPDIGAPLVGDFDGDADDDIVWYAPGAAPDFLWRSTPGGGFVARPLTINQTYRPVVGHHVGDDVPRDDIVWYAPGTAPDFLWRWNGDGFTTSSMTVNGTYEVLGTP